MPQWDKQKQNETAKQQQSNKTNSNISSNSNLSSHPTKLNSNKVSIQNSNSKLQLQKEKQSQTSSSKARIERMRWMQSQRKTGMQTSQMENEKFESKFGSKTKNSTSTKSKWLKIMMAMAGTSTIVAASMTPLWMNLSAQTQSVMQNIGGGFNPNTPIPPAHIPAPSVPNPPAPPFPAKNPVTPPGNAGQAQGDQPTPGQPHWRPNPDEEASQLFTISNNPSIEVSTYTNLDTGQSKPAVYMKISVFKMNTFLTDYFRTVQKVQKLSDSKKVVVFVSDILSKITFDKSNIVNKDNANLLNQWKLSKIGYLDNWDGAENGTAILHVLMDDSDLEQQTVSGIEKVPFMHGKNNVNMENEMYPMNIQITGADIQINDWGFLSPTTVMGSTPANKFEPLKIKKGYEFVAPQITMETQKFTSPKLFKNYFSDSPSKVKGTTSLGNNIGSEEQYDGSNSFVLKRFDKEKQPVGFSKEELGFLQSELSQNGLTTDLTGTEIFFKVGAKAELVDDGITGDLDKGKGFIKVSLTGDVSDYKKYSSWNIGVLKKKMTNYLGVGTDQFGHAMWNPGNELTDNTVMHTTGNGNSLFPQIDIYSDPSKANIYMNPTVLDKVFSGKSSELLYQKPSFNSSLENIILNGKAKVYSNGEQTDLIYVEPFHIPQMIGKDKMWHLHDGVNTLGNHYWEYQVLSGLDAVANKGIYDDESKMSYGKLYNDDGSKPYSDYLKSDSYLKMSKDIDYSSTYKYWVPADDGND